MLERLGVSVKAAIRAACRPELLERLNGRAHLRVVHRRPYDRDDRTGLFVLRKVDDDEVIERKLNIRSIVDEIIDGVRFGRLSEDEAWNLITNVGAIQIHRGAYGTSGLPTNGFNYVALSNDTVTETATSTTLSNEIAANGLSRAQGTVTLPTTSGRITTVDKTFTATGSQSAQKAALFDAASTGNMNHVLSFTQRALITNDTLQTTFSITIS